MNANAQHTPGPWHVVSVMVTPDVQGHSIHADPGDNFRTSFGPLVAGEKLIRSAADGPLIAAAPELLDALRGLIRVIGTTAVYQDYPEFNAARAAISKAMGEQP